MLDENQMLDLKADMPEENVDETPGRKARHARRVEKKDLNDEVEDQDLKKKNRPKLI